MFRKMKNLPKILWSGGNNNEDVHNIPPGLQDAV